MKIYNIFNKYNFNQKGNITIGYFDSMHIGHKKIINELLSISNNKKINAFVLTYKNLPSKDIKFKNILNFEEKLNKLKTLGINKIILSDFDDRFYKIQPIEFIELLKKNFNINEYTISKDFRFGYKRRGTEKELKNAGCTTNFVEPISSENEIISTSSIKEYLKKGNIEKVNSLLGYNYHINGIVKKSKQLGRTIGFPTMNIFNENILSPDDGVYITSTIIGTKTYQSMTYVNKSLIETHLTGYNKFHYNFKIRVDFFKKIRDNAHFPDINALKSQLEKDLIILIDYFKNWRRNDNN